MNTKDYKIAVDLKEKLSKIITLIDFRVFGSRAREENNDDSDMDVFIETDQVNREIKNKIQDITWEVGFDNYMVISPLIFTKDEITNSPLRSSQIVKNILAEGVQV